MLLAPALGTGIVLQHKDWPLWAFQLMALWSGVGGGNFASSMSNISTFFPKRLQGTGLGLNAGLGNFGVTTMQIVIPLVMTVGIFGHFGGEPMTLVKDSGWIFGKIAAGTPTWIQNAGFAWVLSLLLLPELTLLPYLIFGRSRFEGYIAARRQENRQMQLAAQAQGWPLATPADDSVRGLPALAAAAIGSFVAGCVGTDRKSVV